MRNLSEVRDISDELKEGWIFGPHALNFSSPPHKFSTKKQTNHLSKYDEILRFAGKNYLTKQVRLHEYSESYELKIFLIKKFCPCLVQIKILVRIDYQKKIRSNC